MDSEFPERMQPSLSNKPFGNSGSMEHFIKFFPGSTGTISEISCPLLIIIFSGKTGAWFCRLSTEVSEVSMGSPQETIIAQIRIKTLFYNFLSPPTLKKNQRMENYINSELIMQAKKNGIIKYCF